MAQGPRASQEKPTQSSWTSFWRKTRIGDLTRDWDMHKFLKNMTWDQRSTTFSPETYDLWLEVHKCPKRFRIQDVHLSQSKLGPWTQGDKLLEKDWDLGFQVSQNKGMGLKMHKLLHRKLGSGTQSTLLPPPNKPGFVTQAMRVNFQGKT